MVRLKVSSNIAVHSSLVFQFHDGSIKGTQRLEVLSFQSYFNSTMVRLKASLTVKVAVPPLDFNSTMVRLKEEIFSAYGIADIISIPRWFD